MKKEYLKFLKNKVILVTGGTGSIGSELVRELLKYPVKQVRIFSRGEHKQFMLQQALKKSSSARFLIGDIRDRNRVFLAMEGVDIVFNTAAMKHVPMCEFNPFEAVKTNVLGTQNLIEAARAANVEKFIQISTDKAAMPVNVMGATKLLSEKIIISAEFYKGKHKTVFSVVRFGNVFGSRGSVVPIFYDQIKQGGPVTLTDKEMTRFIMEIPQAVTLVLKAAQLSSGGELFIFKMPVMRIGDLAQAMIEVLAPQFGFKPKDIKTKIVGKRSGEKIYEYLMVDEESDIIYENSTMYCLASHRPRGFSKARKNYSRSDETQPLPYKELVAFLKKYFSKYPMV
jgi:FlaA1/EpsC-like NDP-sugar epimerase